MKLRHWIFQANPDHFDIDGYLAGGAQELLYTVSRNGREMQPGDQVFIWRAQGRAKAVSGVIAEGTLLETPAVQPDTSLGEPYWVDRERAREPAMRVRMSINRVANKRQVIRREWLADDPVLNDLTILRMANATNFLLDDHHSRRLDDLWRVTGSDWSRSEDIAALWAYHRTYGGSLSKLPGSPISETALLTGRAVGGVYNKLLNFRSIDPTDSRTGMTGAGTMTKSVWAEFFLPAEGRLDARALEAEFRRLWVEPSGTKIVEAARVEAQNVEEEVERLSSLTLSELMERLNKRSKPRHGADGRPRSSTASTRTFDRDPLIVAIAKKRAGHACEVPDCRHPPFRDRRGQTYCEVHHIHPLADGGPDVLDNLVCLCPAHHVEAHLGEGRDRLRRVFQRVRSTALVEDISSATAAV